jgi:diadenosine tetraphosphate (Ap4A) HIT family hydrolase
VEDWKRDRIGSAARGENPMVLARMRSGFAVIGDTQFLPGYCVLLASRRVGSLQDLDLAARTEFLLDMSLLGDAITAVCNPRRMNYDILGNTYAFLHAHVFPSFDWEPEEYVGRPPFRYPGDRWTDPRYLFSDERHGALKSQLRTELLALLADTGRGV